MGKPLECILWDFIAIHSFAHNYTSKIIANFPLLYVIWLVTTRFFIGSFIKFCYLLQVCTEIVKLGIRSSVREFSTMQCGPIFFSYSCVILMYQTWNLIKINLCHECSYGYFGFALHKFLNGVIALFWWKLKKIRREEGRIPNCNKMNLITLILYSSVQFWYSYMKIEQN